MTKASKVEARYVDRPVGGKQCSACSMFRGPDRCTAVEGTIAPDGHCRFWTAKDIKFQGLPITIETPKGESRTGIGKDGKRWTGPALGAAYGEIKGTRSADGDRLDVYLGDDKRSTKAFVVDQKDAKTGAYDEAKALLGFPTKAKALGTYRKSFGDGKGADRIGGVKETTVAKFREWLQDGDTTKRASVQSFAAGGKVMPLIKSGSKAAIGKNISEMEGSGHSRAQSIAAALDTARRYGKASGGPIGGYAEGGPPRSPVPEWLLAQQAEAQAAEAPLHGGSFPSGLFEPLAPLGEMTGIPSIARASDAYRAGNLGEAAMEVAPFAFPMMGTAARLTGKALTKAPLVTGGVMAGLGLTPSAAGSPEAEGSSTTLKRLLEQQAELTMQRKAALAERDSQAKGDPKKGIPAGRGKNYDASNAEIARIDDQLGRIGTAIEAERFNLSPEGRLKAEKERKAFEETERAKEYGKPIREYLPAALANTLPLIATGLGIGTTALMKGKANREYGRALEGYLGAEKAGDVPNMALRKAQLADLERPSMSRGASTALAALLPAEVRLAETVIDASRDPHSRAYQEAWSRIHDPAAMAFDVGTAGLSSALSYGLGSKLAPFAPDRSLGRAIANQAPYASGPAIAQDYGAALAAGENLRRLRQTSDVAPALPATPLRSSAVEEATVVPSAPPALGLPPAPAAVPSQHALTAPTQPPMKLPRGWSHVPSGRGSQYHNEQGNFAALPKKYRPKSEAKAKDKPEQSKGNKDRTEADEIAPGVPRKPERIPSDEDPGFRNRGGVVSRALEIVRKYARGGKVLVGPVVGATGGRTDALPVDVPAGSYVVPADVVSALGEGNSLAGDAKLRKMFGAPGKHKGDKVAIRISHGEYVISPEQVAKLGHGSVDQGHRILDALIRKIRSEHVKTLANLPPPATS